MTTQPLPHPQRLTRLHIAGLIVILLAASFFRFRQITSASLWMDEIWTVEMATGRGSLHDHLPLGVIQATGPDLTSVADAAPWYQIWTHMDGYAHPPLYYLLLRWWIDLFGVSVLSIRALSAIFSLAGLVVFFDACRLFAAAKTALLAAAIMAVSIAQIDFAQDARNYCLALFFTLAACNALIRMERLGTSVPRLIGLTIFSLAALLTHYFAAGVIAALAAYCLLCLRGPARAKSFVSVTLAGVIFLATWGYWMRRQFQLMPAGIPGFLIERQPHHIPQTFLRILDLPAECLFGETTFKNFSPILFSSIAAAICLLVILRTKQLRHSSLWILLLVGSIGSAATLDLIHDSTLLKFLRYTFLTSPSVYLILAQADWPSRSRFAGFSSALIVVPLIMIATFRATHATSSREDWRQLAGELDTHSAPDDLFVFTNRDFWVTPGTWYLGLQYYTPSFHHPWLILNTPASPDLLRSLRSRDHLWLIGIHPELQAPDLLPGWRPREVVSTSAGGACLLFPTQTDH